MDVCWIELPLQIYTIIRLWRSRTFMENTQPKLLSHEHIKSMRLLEYLTSLFPFAFSFSVNLCWLLESRVSCDVSLNRSDASYLLFSFCPGLPNYSDLNFIGYHVMSSPLFAKSSTGVAQSIWAGASTFNSRILPFLNCWNALFVSSSEQ